MVKLTKTQAAKLKQLMLTSSPAQLVSLRKKLTGAGSRGGLGQAGKTSKRRNRPNVQPVTEDELVGLASMGLGRRRRRRRRY